MQTRLDAKTNLRRVPRQIPRLRALVFDFDGTLAKLTLDFDIMRDQLSTLALDFSPSPPDPFAHSILEWQTLFADQLNDKTIEGKESAAAFMSQSSNLILDMEVEAAKRGMLFPFTRSMLQSLRESDIEVAIITRNCARAVHCVFPDYVEFCPTLLTRDDVRLVKPAPEHLFSALERICRAPQESLMVGDHPMDILTGKRAGAWTAGVASGRVSQLELLESGADIIAADCDELTRKLRVQGAIK